MLRKALLFGGAERYPDDVRRVRGEACGDGRVVELLRPGGVGQGDEGHGFHRRVEGAELLAQGGEGGLVRPQEGHAVLGAGDDVAKEARAAVGLAANAV